MGKYDFGGWATRNDLLCGDGVTIKRDAFKHNDGKQVPLLWMHDHGSPDAVLGHAVLENREDGVYAYGKFNDLPQGKHAWNLVKNGDVSCLSIWANQLKKLGSDVIHGDIKELSLVLAGKNPGAFIDMVMAHGEDAEEELNAGWDENALVIYHSDDEEDEEMAEETKKPESGEKTVKQVYDEMTEEQKTAVQIMVGMAVEEATGETDEEEETAEHGDIEEGGNEIMHSNVFDNTQNQKKETVLSHADEMEIIELAKQPSVGSLKTAMSIWASEHNDTLAHAFDTEGDHAISKLFPDYKDVHPGAPELIERDQSWISAVLDKAHKSPISRIRTRQADARANELRAKGYNNRAEEKKLSGNLKLLMRYTDPQTIYRRDELHRDDIIDITDFSVVAYVKTIMKHNMREELALAALIGDGRDDLDQDKIHPEHIRPIWGDEDLYSIHYDIDLEAAREEIQGTDTTKHFSESYIRAEAMVQASLFSREDYKGKGQPDMFIDPHELNIMLLSRDLNGRRIYASRAELATALNVNEIHTVEQFRGKTRQTEDGKTKKLLAILVNMGNYQFGATKGGEITDFQQFDIDFNKEKFLSEARCSGALVNIKSAVCLEEDVTPAAEG